MAQEHPPTIKFSVDQILKDWTESPDILGIWKFEVEETQFFSSALKSAFNKLALNSLLYTFEFPARIGKNEKIPASAFLGADELLRILSLFPEIAASIASTCAPGNFSKILELAKGYNCLCDFLGKNFKKYFPVIEEEETGLYYLPKAEETATVKIAPSPGIFGKRKRENVLVKRIQ